MLKSIRFATLCAAIAAACVAQAGENDLFSDVRIKSVFDTAAPAETLTEAAIGRRITGAEDLRDKLNAAGLDASAAGSRSVTLKKKLDPWEFPVLVTMSEDESQIAIMLGLRSISDSKKLTANELLRMMAASQKNAPHVFAYNSDRERTELYTILKNEGLSGQLLRDTINRMAVVAKANEDVWAEKATPDTPAGTTPTVAAAPEQPATVAPAAPNLTGKWSAARSATEAFAVEFTADGTFKLVYVNNGSQTKSAGQYTLSGETLTLSGSGLKLTGKIVIKSASEFTLTLEKSAALTFRKAA